MLSSAFKNYLESELFQKIVDIAPQSGGSINEVYKITTANDKFLLKINSWSKYPLMFRREADGLNAIAATGAIKTPQIILQGKAGDTGFLLLEWIDARRATTKAAETLGRQLAAMHQHSADYFGFESDNYIGLPHQSNKKHQTWSRFFIEERLEPMVKMATDKHLLNQADVSDFGNLYNNLPGLFPEEPPALLHGDLWGGNYLAGDNDLPYLIDPAVSYGHREFDIAMTKLFGGFSNTFYEAYHEAYPLAADWEQTIDLWNLYPLLVHLNLFGTGYLSQVRDCLRKYL